MKSLTPTFILLGLLACPTLSAAQISSPLTTGAGAGAAADAADASGASQVVHARTASTSDPAPTPAARPHQRPPQTPIGAATDALMRAQANGTHAGPLLPTLGATASRSYQRYLKSFTTPLPDDFKQSVGTNAR